MPSIGATDRYWSYLPLPFSNVTRSHMVAVGVAYDDGTTTRENMRLLDLVLATIPLHEAKHRWLLSWQPGSIEGVEFYVTIMIAS